MDLCMYMKQLIFTLVTEWLLSLFQDDVTASDFNIKAIIILLVSAFSTFVWVFADRVIPNSSASIL